MSIDVLTLFPAMFSGPLSESILKRAQEENLLSINLHDLREHGIGKHRQVDDEPYGGGAGMVLRCDVVVSAIESVQEKSGERSAVSGERAQSSCHRILLTPRGKTLTQERVEELAQRDHLLLLCGHYEGVDQRVVDGGFIDEEISIGDYVLTGGELPAMVLIDAVARHIPGVLGAEESAHEESFSSQLDRKKEYPHYTRPEMFRSLDVPEVLRSGHHQEIENWRKNQCL